MSVKVSVICFKSKVLANGEHPIVLRISENKKRVTKSLGISVKAQHWDFKKEEPKPKCPNRDLIISIILNVKSEYQSKILEKIAHDEEFTATSLMHVGNFSCHSLRKTFGRQVYTMNDNNAELALVKLMELFNHSNVAITKRYLGLRQEEILQTYDCLSF